MNAYLYDISGVYERLYRDCGSVCRHQNKSGRNMAPENGLAVQLDLLMAGMTDEKCLGDAKKDQLGRRSIHEVMLSVPMSLS